jgi:hypothetical protein
MPLGRAAAAYACVPIPPFERFLETNLRFVSLTPYFCLILFSIVSVAEYEFKYVSLSGLDQMDGYFLSSFAQCLNTWCRWAPALHLYLDAFF